MNLLFWYRSLMRSVGATLVKLIATATSGLVSFTTNVIRPVKVVCEFSPIQEGTGDPSPDNVRPISGWTDATINHYQINLLGPRISGTRFSTYIKKGTAVTASSNSTSGNQTVRFYNKNGTQVRYYYLQSYDAGREYRDYTTEQDIYSIDLPNTNPTVRRGTRQYTYDPTYADIIKILFVDANGNPLTVYGGTVTLNEDGSADVAGTRLSIEFDGSADEDWRFEKTANGYKNAYIAMPSTFKTSQISSTEMICSASPTNATKIGTTYRAVKDACYISNGRNFNFCWLDTLEISSANDFKAWLQDGHSLQVVATLINPITSHFDNIGQLQSFLGTNNIWHNMNGSITAEYYKKQ